jgi:hypothetical protein
MTDDQWSRDPNVDTFDHVGERDHEGPPATEPIKALALRIGPPANERGEIFAAGSIKPTNGIPVTRMFDSSDVIGTADVAADGTVTIRLGPGVAVPAGATVETGLGFRVHRDRWDGDDRVVEELEAITVGVEFKPAAPRPAAGGIHEAGPLEHAVQLCRRCGAVLSDYRGAMIPIGDPPLVGWAIGAHVEVDGDNPRSSWVTEAAPTCEARS